MNLEEMSMEELLVDHRKYNTFGIQKAVESEAEILRRDKEKEERIKELEERLRVAVLYLREAKAKFAPNTTNSLVDTFIKEYDRATTEVKEKEE